MAGEEARVLLDGEGLLEEVMRADPRSSCIVLAEKKGRSQTLGGGWLKEVWLLYGCRAPPGARLGVLEKVMARLSCSILELREESKTSEPWSVLREVVPRSAPGAGTTIQHADELLGFKTELLHRTVGRVGRNSWLDVRVVRWFVPREMLQAVFDEDTPALAAHALKGAPGAAEEIDMTDFLQATRLCDVYY